jgi:hypothetical protein
MLPKDADDWLLFARAVLARTIDISLDDCIMEVSLSPKSDGDPSTLSVSVRSAHEGEEDDDLFYHSRYVSLRDAVEELCDRVLTGPYPTLYRGKLESVRDELHRLADKLDETIKKYDSRPLSSPARMMLSAISKESINYHEADDALRDLEARGLIDVNRKRNFIVTLTAAGSNALKELP